MTPTERLGQLRVLAADGVTKPAAAARVGLSVRGLDTFLYRHEGTTKWPMRK